MVKQGYKQTEIGVIPEDWEVKELKEIVELRREKVNPLTSKEVFRCIELENILPDTGRIVGEIYTNEVVSLKTKFFKHDVLFGKLRPYLRKYAFPDFDGVCTSEIWVLYSKLISHNFLYYIFQTDKLIELANQSTGTKMPRAEWSIVSSLKIPLPPLREQEAIAEALSDADAWIESLEQLIAKKRLIKQGAMQELLTPKDDWEVKKLGEVSSSYSGGTPNTANDEYYNGEINFIGSGDLNQSIIRNVEGKITEQGLINSSAKMIDPDTLLIAMYGATAGVVAISKIRGAINQAILAVLPIKGYLTEFIYYFFTLKKDWIIKTYTQGGQPNLSGGILKNIEIPFPPLSEQERIATILSDMDAEIEALEQKLGKARQIKQGMMQELLTGSIRL